MFTGRKSSLHSTTLLHSWPGFFHLNLFLSLNSMNPRCALSYHTKTPHWQLWTTIRMKFTFRVVCTRSRVGISATFTELRPEFFFPNVFPSLNPPIIRYALSLCVCVYGLDPDRPQDVIQYSCTRPAIPWDYHHLRHYIHVADHEDYGNHSFFFPVDSFAPLSVCLVLMSS